jgi:hypothetical protein
MGQSTSTVNNITFPYALSDNKGFVVENNIKGIPLLKFWLKIYMNYRKADKRLAETLSKKVCYYGPFKGEFGHFLAHTLPFLMYLHKNGVEIRYCGMELHRPFLVDEQGQSIVKDYRSLRDFFAEVPPDSNAATPPADVQAEIKKFEREAEQSGKPFWNIGDDYYYWFIHRNWLGKGYVHLYNLSHVYKTKNENAVCIFPRSKGAASSHNNGDPWDYQKMIESIKPYFDKIYVVGHPSQSLSIPVSDKVEIRITADNRQILEACSNSRLIITQHSGVNNLGEYLQKQVLIIYKGGKQVSDIGSMNNTLRFRNFMKEKIPLAFAYSEEDIVNYIKSLKK